MSIFRKVKIRLDSKLCHNTTLEIFFNLTTILKFFFDRQKINYILKYSCFKSFRKHKYLKKSRFDKPKVILDPPIHVLNF